MPIKAMKFKNAMLIDIKSARLQLGKDQHVWLRGAFNTRLTSANGLAWITFENDAGDVVISPGNSFVVPPDKTVLIGPVGGSATLDVQGERAAPTKYAVNRESGARHD